MMNLFSLSNSSSLYKAVLAAYIVAATAILIFVLEFFDAPLLFIVAINLFQIGLAWFVVRMILQTRKVFQKIGQVSKAVKNGDFHHRVIEHNEKGEVGDIINCFNDSIDVSDAFTREAHLAMQASAEGRYYRKIILTGLKGLFRKSAIGINDAIDVMAKHANNAETSMNEIERMLAENKRGIAEIARVLSALANMDLTQRVEGEYGEEFEKLKRDTNIVADRLSEIIKQLQETSHGLKSATSEILAGANDLSDRTTKQAATIEETSAAMEQLSSTVIANAERAEEASNNSRQVAMVAEEGEQVMHQANEAMERITNSSEKISNIIGMIDDIAFQTNLLALNASVEAARAGEAGKGFAVVAVEVRRLAQSAAEASSEVKELIEQSGAEVASGTKLVNEAAKKLASMLEAIRENSTLLVGIAKDSREQASSIEEVNGAVRQMDEMTQHNAALVEQTNAAIEQTEAQANELDNIVEIFKLDGSVSNSDVQSEEDKSSSSSSLSGGIRAIKDKVSKAAKTYLSKGNAAIKQDDEWAEF